MAVAWGLKKARYFVAGCKDLIVATDHKPLLGILNDKELDSIDNGRLVKLKQKTLTYRFNIQYTFQALNKKLQTQLAGIP